MRSYEIVVYGEMGYHRQIIQAKNQSEAYDIARKFAYKLSKHGDLFLQGFTVTPIKKRQ